MTWLAGNFIFLSFNYSMKKFEVINCFRWDFYCNYDLRCIIEFLILVPFVRCSIMFGCLQLRVIFYLDTRTCLSWFNSIMIQLFENVNDWFCRIFLQIFLVLWYKRMLASSKKQKRREWLISQKRDVCFHVVQLGISLYVSRLAIGGGGQDLMIFAQHFPQIASTL
jgi:hypothetical protein